jgi:hypothetical protein
MLLIKNKKVINYFFNYSSRLDTLPDNDITLYLPLSETKNPYPKILKSNIEKVTEGSVFFSLDSLFQDLLNKNIIDEIPLQMVIFENYHTFNSEDYNRVVTEVNEYLNS